MGTGADFRQVPVRNPRTGAVDAHVPAWDDARLRELAAGLRQAQPAWLALGPAGRAKVLQAFAADVAANGAAIGAALAIDTGRVRLAVNEVNALGGLVAGYSALASALLPEALERASLTPGIGIRTQLVPYQLVGVISPWNFPLLLSILDAIPALMAGGAVIVKPSEVTPRFVAPLMAVIQRHPGLASVLAFITGDGETGAALIGQVDALCFTGSVATGLKVAESCARHFIPAFLELGGKDPAIVLSSADPDVAASIVLRGSVQATGQACQSIERVYVPGEMADAFVARLVARAEAVELNYPDIGRGQVGPFIFGKQAGIVAGHLADAVARGAKIRTGGAIEHHGGGAWLRPTVVTGVDHTMALVTEETFGPVIPVMAYGDLDEAVRLANDSRYGLSAVVIGDEAEAIAVASRLAVGSVSINDSGLTTEVYDAEKNAFRLSGMGASRMGPSGLLRFLRKRALLIQRGRAKTLADFDESGR
jgi:acyl-CoA reductase-like NAD-dependent aldehyde dehydrogenase